MSLLLIVDIDGTITNASERFKQAGIEPFRHNQQAYIGWVEKVMKNASLDRPVTGMASLLTILGAMGLADIVYVTSREERWRGETEKWLKEHRFPIYPIYMRPDGSWEEVDELKERLIKRAKYTYKASEIIVIDDDQKGEVELMCKANGFTFLKAKSGS